MNIRQITPLVDAFVATLTFRRMLLLCNLFLRLKDHFVKEYSMFNRDIASVSTCDNSLYV
jgi:hypothetical protein